LEWCVLSVRGMAGARHYSQLIAWQLANALRDVILTFTRRPSYLDDFRLRGQTDDAIDSVCRNIAEGFGCISHIEFARYLEISRRSLNEVCDAVHSARSKGYVSAEDAAEVYKLTRRLYPALNQFIAYLKRNPNGGRGRQIRSQGS
jgi:four helix bundle protein